ncbi:MAG: hypothetical protein KKC29_07790 [Alphaproteobacteria bacterium]|jgi:hypothetical protein|nr:hypothetical protein [Alphaproteobacteria bacterium]MBU2043131.1 hypothetical protein [Alphaproteobacteria bacterium]MBU2124461.1 hypothetical protein [Alphaproteobacteria bacterium]MBU2207689.1 hypothetical protein [Alphaproteobacteria bacterium]MBU2290988.1 hypothetical protein [Alphaproteobacteria bacterium]
MFIDPGLPVDDEDDFSAKVYGDGQEAPPPSAVTKKSAFAPWHHPIKQIVRDYQWGDAAVRLLSGFRAAERRGVLRYFTLPGADLLDVRQLATAIQGMGSQVEYFGFNTGWKPDGSDRVDGSGAYLSAESALRQAGRVTDSSVVWPDSLEDIAQPKSTAADRLAQQSVFDIVNIDACDHLGYASPGRKQTLFDAMESLLAHQLRATEPWLLFLTTRADPKLLGGPSVKLMAAIQKNLDAHPDGFGDALADCLGVDKAVLISDLNAVWGSTDERFLKLFVLALGKHLLHFYFGQVNFKVTVELVSAFAYRVHGAEPDMVSVAFRMTPGGLRIHPAAAKPVVVLEQIELADANAIAAKTKAMWNLENGIQDSKVATDAVNGTLRLLEQANYDLEAWKLWLQNHPIRPMTV